MSATAHVLLDEHVGRVFERVLDERGYHVTQAKDRFGEQTTDRGLLLWCGENDVLLLTNNAKDFEPLHHEVNHAGLLLFYDQRLPDDDPERLARAVDEAIEQYGIEGVANELVDLGVWHDWLHE